MPFFNCTVQGVALAIPLGMINPPLQAALESGRYEASLARAVTALLRPDDVFFELGAGVRSEEHTSELQSLV